MATKRYDQTAETLLEASPPFSPAGSTPVLVNVYFYSFWAFRDPHGHLYTTLPPVPTRHTPWIEVDEHAQSSNDALCDPFDRRNVPLSRKAWPALGRGRSWPVRDKELDHPNCDEAATQDMSCTARVHARDRAYIRPLHSDAARNHSDCASVARTPDGDCEFAIQGLATTIAGLVYHAVSWALRYIP